MRIVSISLAAALVTAITLSTAFSAERRAELPAPVGDTKAVRYFLGGN
jgi:hypothetical protein